MDDKEKNIIDFIINSDETQWKRDRLDNHNNAWNEDTGGWNIDNKIMFQLHKVGADYKTGYSRVDSGPYIWVGKIKSVPPDNTGFIHRYIEENSITVDITKNTYDKILCKINLHKSYKDEKFEEMFNKKREEGLSKIHNMLIEKGE